MSSGVVLSILAVLVVLGIGGAVLVDRRADLNAARAEARFPPLGQLVEIDGRQVHVRVEGSGPDLVLLHGAGGNLRDFTFDFVDRVKDRYRVIAFDRPGHGWTEQTDPAFDRALARSADGPEAQAAFLQAAAREVGVTRPIVLGQSFGGAVAMAWALNHDPAAVVMVSGVSHPWPGTLSWSYRLGGSVVGGVLALPLVAAFPPESYVDASLERIFAPNRVPEGYSRHFGPALTLRLESLRANMRQVNSLRPHVVRMAEAYPDLSLPIEIVHGEDDRVVPPEIHAIPMSQRVESARYQPLAGVGHMPHHGAPEAVIDAIDRAAARAGLR